jgi:hypothetical protein
MKKYDVFLPDIIEAMVKGREGVCGMAIAARM